MEIRIVLCAPCMTAGLNAASRIEHRAGNTSTLIHERGSQFPKRIYNILVGDDELDPSGEFVINGMGSTDCRAITMIGGTAVCSACIYTVMEERRNYRSRYGGMW